MFKKKYKKIEFEQAPDVMSEILKVLPNIQMEHINPAQIITMRSFNSKARANARIWSFPRIWQVAFKTKPYYVLEVLSEFYDKLSSDQQKKVIIHELLHIPKNFSGALVPHKTRYSKINSKTVDKIFEVFLKNEAPKGDK